MSIWKPTSIVAKILLCTVLLLPIVLRPQAGFNIARAEGLPTTIAVASASDELRRYTEEVIQQLSSSEPFTSWSNATSVIEPLGPGTHSWLVTIKPQHSTAGYLIISLTEKQEYKLVEYGTGPDSLYVRSTLESALKGNGISRQGKSTVNVVPVYGGPVVAEWEITKPSSSNKATQFLDALTGELLPESKDSLERQVANYKAPEQAAGNFQQELLPERTIYTAKIFDPYDNILWMTSNALLKGLESFETLLKASKRLVFVSSGPERTYSIPLPIHGYQKWSGTTTNTNKALDSNETIYVLTGSESSSRWISLHALTDCGYFVAYAE